MYDKKILIILIMLECRLSITSASKLFKTSEEEIKLIMADSPRFYKEGLDYLLYETANNSPQKEQRTEFFAINYIFKVNGILNIPNKKERTQEYIKLINKLMDAEILKLLNSLENKDSKFWAKDKRKQLLNFKLKNALSNRDIQKHFGVNQHTVARWINELEEGDFKERLLLLKEYLLNKSVKIYLKRK